MVLQILQDIEQGKSLLFMWRTKDKMTDPLHVLLGRNGDIILALPALKKWADQHGRPAALLTSSEFLPMLEGCSYVKATAMDWSFHDLHAVLAYLKNDLPQVPVKCLQFYGNGDEKSLPSFWHEQMYLAGLLGGVEDEPLVFDQRDGIREMDLLCTHGIWQDKRPTILVALEGKSSPFKDAEVLMDTIVHAFPDCNIIDLSIVKADHIYDLLGLYDHAAALISIDTVHLHLSRASKVPVFALARDYPTRWHGTPQLDRFTWYCRYGQVMERIDEMIEALRNTLSGQQKPKPNFTNIPKGCYNPSIIVHEGETLMSYRYHPDRTWRTQLKINDVPVRFPYPVSSCAHEDMRLFHFKGELWASYVCSRGSKLDPRCVNGYGKLLRKDDCWVVEQHFQPDMLDNDFSAMQKNAVPFVQNDTIHLIWKDNLIARMDDDDLNQWETEIYIERPTWPYGEIRGGTSPLPFHGKWLRFFHSRIWDRENGKPWRYHMGALVMEPYPPFNVLHVSKTPILSGDESGDPVVWHYKHSVVFPLGAIEDDGGWLVSLGINDAHCAVIKLKEEDLNL